MKRVGSGIVTRRPLILQLIHVREDTEGGKHKAYCVVILLLLDSMGLGKIFTYRGQGKI